jgi:Mrp family chromosome partitioning ATPase
VLAARADGVVLVVETKKTRREAVQRAMAGLEKVGANILGAVLNMVPAGKGSGYYQYYSYSPYTEDGQGAPRRRRRSRHNVQADAGEQAESSGQVLAAGDEN